MDVTAKLQRISHEYSLNFWTVPGSGEKGILKGGEFLD
jgi:hypothetical protein